MNRRTLVVGTAIAAIAVFAGGAVVYTQTTRQAAQQLATERSAALVREHAPILGPADAPVTIVEFFDPSCEACRAFYPVVKQIMALYPEHVRLVMRYAAFHDGSDEAVRIIEAARRQDKFTPVIEVLLAEQDTWAKHDGPDLERAWQLASTAGLDLTKGRTDATLPEVTAILTQDTADAQALQIRQTPTFFVNGRTLDSFGPQQLFELVTEEVVKAGGQPAQ